MQVTEKSAEEIKKGHKIVSKSDYESLESVLAAEKKKYTARKSYTAKIFQLPYQRILHQSQVLLCLFIIPSSIQTTLEVVDDATDILHESFDVSSAQVNQASLRTSMDNDTVHLVNDSDISGISMDLNNTNFPNATNKHFRSFFSQIYPELLFLESNEETLDLENMQTHSHSNQSPYMNALEIVIKDTQRSMFNEFEDFISKYQWESKPNDTGSFFDIIDEDELSKKFEESTFGNYASTNFLDVRIWKRVLTDKFFTNKYHIFFVYIFFFSFCIIYSIGFRR